MPGECNLQTWKHRMSSVIHYLNIETPGCSDLGAFNRGAPPLCARTKGFNFGIPITTWQPTVEHGPGPGYIKGTCPYSMWRRLRAIRSLVQQCVTGEVGLGIRWGDDLKLSVLAIHEGLQNAIAESSEFAGNGGKGGRGTSTPPIQNQNTVETLSQGIVKSSHYTVQYTILLIGETGAGKTSLLCLLANIFAGRDVGRYRVLDDTVDETGNNAKQGEGSVTLRYTLESHNKVKFRILSFTPPTSMRNGARKLEDKDRANLVASIQNLGPILDAVLVLANGTIPRLGTGTKQTLSSLLTLFPNTLVSNISILFTNVASPLGLNISQDSLPSYLRSSDKQFIIDNPFAMWTKLMEMGGNRNGSEDNSGNLKLEGTVKDGHQKALVVLARLLNWLDELKSYPTKGIVTAEFGHVLRGLGF